MTSVQPDLAARVAAAQARLEVEAETWNPKDSLLPREIAGLIVERRVLPGAGFEGADAEQVVVQTPEGRFWKFRLYGAVLQNEFTGLGAGDVVAVRYLGRQQGGSGPNGYEGYTVTVDRGVQASPAAAAQPDPVHREPDQPRAQRDEDPRPATSTLPPCEACGMLNGHHAKSCPLGDDEIPF